MWQTRANTIQGPAPKSRPASGYYGVSVPLPVTHLTSLRLSASDDMPRCDSEECPRGRCNIVGGSLFAQEVEKTEDYCYSADF